VHTINVKFIFLKGIDKDLILIINFFNLEFLWFWHHLIIFSIWIFSSILCNTSYTIWLSYKSLWVNVLLTSNAIGVISYDILCELPCILESLIFKCWFHHFKMLLKSLKVLPIIICDSDYWLNSSIGMEVDRLIKQCLWKYGKSSSIFYKDLYEPYLLVISIFGQVIPIFWIFHNVWQ
jgi:hypothetical protein